MNRYPKIIYLFFCLIQCLNCLENKIQFFNTDKCKTDLYFNTVLKPEIQSKSLTINRIINLILNSNEKNKTYEELAEFADLFGGRFSGSESLEESIDYLVEKLKNYKADRVYTENVQVPHWKRGEEWARMVEPREQKLSILGLAGSVSTPKSGISGQLLVLNSLKDLNDLSKDVIKDKIVLFNNNRVNDSYVKFKLNATRMVAEAEGLAVLFKSFAKEAIYSPHAGIIRYYSKELQIPAASIAAEDSDLLTRIYRRDAKIVLNVSLESTFIGLTKSRNIIAELVGTEFPNQMVIISAHVDSWDVGQGALDDGGGVLICLRALALFSKLGLRPKRTLRLVLFTGEEIGRFGSKAYVNSHIQEMENISLIMNSDFGTFEPFGLTFSGDSPRAQCIVYQTLQLLNAINSTDLVVGKGFDLTQGDANEFLTVGVPAAGLLNDNRKFWYYSHTNGDSVSALDPYSLDLCTIVWTAASYVFADLTINLPKT